MTEYEQKILDAFKRCCDENAQKEGIRAASATEVCNKMIELGTLARLDTVIDIADQLAELSTRGYLVL